MDQGAARVSLHPRGMRLLRWIIGYQRRAGYAPSTREMALAIGTQSTGSVRYHLNILARHGHILLAHGIARAVCVTESGRKAAARPPGGV